MPRYVPNPPLFYLLSFFSKALTRASAAENAALLAKCSFSLAVRCFSASMT